MLPVPKDPGHSQRNTNRLFQNTSVWRSCNNESAANQMLTISALRLDHVQVQLAADWRLAAHGMPSSDLCATAVTTKCSCEHNACTPLERSHKRTLRTAHAELFAQSAARGADAAAAFVDIAACGECGSSELCGCACTGCDLVSASSSYG